MSLFQKCLVLFTTGFVVDLLQTFHIQACADRSLALSVSTLFALYIVGFWGHDWFVQSKSCASRWALTMSGALGAGLGTGIVIYLGS